MKSIANHSLLTPSAMREKNLLPVGTRQEVQRPFFYTSAAFPSDIPKVKYFR
jgi:hypothetical protein